MPCGRPAIRIQAPSLCRYPPAQLCRSKPLRPGPGGDWASGGWKKSMSASPHCGSENGRATCRKTLMRWPRVPRRRQSGGLQLRARPDLPEVEKSKGAETNFHRVIREARNGCENSHRGDSHVRGDRCAGSCSCSQSPVRGRSRTAGVWTPAVATTTGSVAATTATEGPYRASRRGQPRLPLRSTAAPALTVRRSSATLRARL